MKNIIGKGIVAAAILVAQQSFAAPLACVSDDGWRFETNSRQTKATLTQNGEAVEFGKLKCKTAESTDNPGELILSCSSTKHVADGGYGVTVALGATGMHTKGVLTIISIAGATNLDLACTSAAD